MSRNRWAIAGLVALLLLSGWVGWLLNDGGTTGSSMLSRAPGGWLGARVVLESRGVAVDFLDRPLDHLEATDDDRSATWVLAAPWSRPIGATEIDAVSAHLRRGGTVLLAYGGAAYDPIERDLFDRLTLETTDPLWPTLVPWRWRADRNATWTLIPATSPLANNRPVVIAAPRRWPEPPANATVLYQGPDGQAAVFRFPRHGGTVVVLPANAWSNARLAEPGNGDLLATVASGMGPVWRVDEYHHGLVDLDIAAARRQANIVLAWGPVRLTFWELMLMQLLLLYALSVGTMARRFGPVWRDTVVRSGSTAAFLRNVGAVHDRLGHHRDAARALVQRAARLDPALPVEALHQQAETVDNGPGLVALGRRLATAQHRRIHP